MRLGCGDLLHVHAREGLLRAGPGERLHAGDGGDGFGDGALDRLRALAGRGRGLHGLFDDRRGPFHDRLVHDRLVRDRLAGGGAAEAEHHDREGDVPGRDAVLAGGVCQRQGLAREPADLARDPVGEVVQGPAGLGREPGLPGDPRDRDAVADVVLGLRGAQRIEPVAGGDAPPQGLAGGVRERLLEGRLSRQDELQQGVAVGLEVRIQPQVVEQGEAEFLRLLHHQDGRAARSRHRPQPGLEPVGGRRGARRVVRARSEAREGLREELLARERRRGDDRHPGAGAGRGERGLDGDRLAHAGQAGQQRERLPALERAAQVRDRLAVRAARVEEAGIVTVGERVLAGARQIG